jgi:adenine-specific DNA-methyltransferase
MEIDFEKLNQNSVTQVSFKNSFGEVFTPTALIEEMLELLPEEIWQNSHKKWLDPAAGVGNFHACVFKRLMVGLQNSIPDETKRVSHILENMFYFVEIQQKNVEIIQELFNKNKKYKLNIFNGDFLSLNIFDFNVMQFDIVLGNPPYQDMFAENIRKAKNHNLWSSFIESGFNLLSNNGYLLFITPPAWMSPSSKVLNDIFLKNQLIHVNIGECSKYFNGIGSQFSYFLVQKKIPLNETTFVYDFKGGSFIKKSKGVSKIKLTNKVEFIPQIPSKEAFSILQKTVFSKKEKFNVIYDSDLHKFTKKEFLSDVELPTHPFKILHTPTQIVWSIRPHKFQDRIKLFIPLTTYYENLIIDICGNTQGLGYILFENFEDAEKAKLILSSKLYRFIANITRWSNFNVPMVMKKLPLYPISKIISDEEIFDYFNLTSTEIDYIESILKPNHIAIQLKLEAV